jgi:hypothetical protein
MFQTGAVTIILRFGSAAKLNVHFQSLALGRQLSGRNGRVAALRGGGGADASPIGRRVGPDGDHGNLERSPIDSAPELGRIGRPADLEAMNLEGDENGARMDRADIRPDRPDIATLADARAMPRPWLIR